MSSHYPNLSRRSVIFATPMIMGAAGDSIFGAVRTNVGPTVNVFDFMAPDQIGQVQARTRRADVTRAVQAAIDSRPAALFFPPGDYPVSPNSRLRYALIVRNLSIEMYGDGATIAMASIGNFQALRIENCFDTSLRGLRFAGSGTNGTNGGQGLVQVYGGSNFTAENCAFDEANCDGIAIAEVAGVTLSGCSSRKASKAALYVNNSSNVRVLGNTATSFGGHLAGAHVVGVGLQLSGNAGVLAQNNTVSQGVGVGILCDNSGPRLPKGNRLIRNTVINVSNPQYPEVSGGIRLTNDQPSKDCDTIVAENTVRGCGFYNFYVENQDGAVIQGNIGIESYRSNFVFSRVSGITVSNNTAINTDTSGGRGQYAYYLINGARSVNGVGNKAVTMARYAAASGANAVADVTGNKNAIALIGN